MLLRQHEVVVPAEEKDGGLRRIGIELIQRPHNHSILQSQTLANGGKERRQVVRRHGPVRRRSQADAGTEHRRPRPTQGPARRHAGVSRTTDGTRGHSLLGLGNPGGGGRHETGLARAVAQRSGDIFVLRRHRRIDREGKGLETAVRRALFVRGGRNGLGRDGSINAFALPGDGRHGRFGWGLRRRRLNAPAYPPLPDRVPCGTHDQQEHAENRNGDPHSGRTPLARRVPPRNEARPAAHAHPVRVAPHANLPPPQTAATRVETAGHFPRGDGVENAARRDAALPERPEQTLHHGGIRGFTPYLFGGLHGPQQLARALAIEGAVREVINQLLDPFAARHDAPPFFRRHFPRALRARCRATFAAVAVTLSRPARCFSEQPS